jgi:hypothetical protein
MSLSAQPGAEGAWTRIRSRVRTAWFVLAVMLAFSVAAPLNQAKVLLILPIRMDAFHLTVGRSWLLMWVYAMAGLIFQRLGYRLTGFLAGGSIMIGAVAGWLSRAR